MSLIWKEPSRVGVSLAALRSATTTVDISKLHLSSFVVPHYICHLRLEDMEVVVRSLTDARGKCQVYHVTPLWRRLDGLTVSGLHTGPFWRR